MLRQLMREFTRKMFALAVAGAGFVGMEAVASAQTGTVQLLDPAPVPAVAQEIAPAQAQVPQSTVGGILSNMLGQAPPPPAAAGDHVVGSDLNMKAKWKDGLYLSTEQNDFWVKVGGRLHMVNDWFGSESRALRNGVGTYQDSSFFRRARLRVEGGAYEVFNWTVEYEFATSDEVRFREVYADVTKLPVIGNIRFGQTTEPNGFDTISSDRYIAFMERSPLHNTFYPEYNPGVMIYNQIAENRIMYQLGVFRDDGASDIGRHSGKGDYNYDARVVFLPIYEQEGRCMLHVGGTYHHQDSNRDTRDVANGGANNATNPAGALGTPTPFHTVTYAIAGSFRTGKNTPALVNTGAMLCDGVDVFGTELFANLGPLHIQGEFAVANVNSYRGNSTNAAADLAALGKPAQGDARLYGGYIQAGYFLTGENMNYSKKLGALDRLKVIEPFFLVKGDDGSVQSGWGAIQLVARYSFLNLNDDSRVRGGIENDFIAGVDWYLNSNLKFMFHGFRTNLSGSPTASTGNVNGLQFNVLFDF